MVKNNNSHITKTCLKCNKILDSRDPRTRYCNRECYVSHRAPELKCKRCVYCYKEFLVDNMTRRKQHCSLKCRYQAFSQRKMPPPKNAHKTCKGCGAIFDANHCKRLYCNHKCYISYRKQMGWQTFSRPGVNYYLRMKRMHLPCRACGEAEADIHHIDGNHKNNVEENLIPLCKKCHSLVHSLVQSAKLGIKHFSDYFVNHYHEIFYKKAG